MIDPSSPSATKMIAAQTAAAYLFAQQQLHARTLVTHVWGSIQRRGERGTRCDAACDS
jgi:hypothetical protein